MEYVIHNRPVRVTPSAMCTVACDTLSGIEVKDWTGRVPNDTLAGIVAFRAVQLTERPRPEKVERFYDYDGD
jgi:hypothetical protein